MANSLQYITVPIQTNPDELAQTAYDRIQELVDGWEPNDGNFEVIVIEAIATMIAEARDVASAVPLAIFRYFGQTVMNIPAIEAIEATVLTDWHLADTVGHVIPAGTPILISNNEGEQFAFEVVADTNVPEGSNEAQAVLVTAQVPGAASSGLKGPIEQISGLGFIASISYNAATTATAGGADEESDSEYLNRLSAELSLLAPRPIVPRDFSLISTNITGVHRALAIDGYNPETKTVNNERVITVVPLDAEGKAVTESIRNKLKEYLEEIREVNFQVFVIAPTFVEVDVSITVHMIEGYDKSATEQIVKDAIRNFLEPQNWGNSPGRAGIPIWRNEQDVRQGSIATIANQNIGVAYVDLPTIGEHGKTLKAEDFVMSSVAPLPKPGTITVNVVVP